MPSISPTRLSLYDVLYQETQQIFPLIADITRLSLPQSRLGLTLSIQAIVSGLLAYDQRNENSDKITVIKRLLLRGNAQELIHHPMMNLATMQHAIDLGNSSASLLFGKLVLPKVCTHIAKTIDSTDEQAQSILNATVNLSLREMFIFVENARLDDVKMHHWLQLQPQFLTDLRFGKHSDSVKNSQSSEQNKTPKSISTELAAYDSQWHSITGYQPTGVRVIVDIEQSNNDSMSDVQFESMKGIYVSHDSWLLNLAQQIDDRLMTNPLRISDSKSQVIDDKKAQSTLGLASLFSDNVKKKPLKDTENFNSIDNENSTVSSENDSTKEHSSDVSTAINVSSNIKHNTESVISTNDNGKITNKQKPLNERTDNIETGNDSKNTETDTPFTYDEPSSFWRRPLFISAASIASVLALVLVFTNDKKENVLPALATGDAQLQIGSKNDLHKPDDGDGNEDADNSTIDDNTMSQNAGKDTKNSGNRAIQGAGSAIGIANTEDNVSSSGDSVADGSVTSQNTTSEIDGTVVESTTRDISNNKGKQTEDIAIVRVDDGDSSAVTDVEIAQYDAKSITKNTDSDSDSALARATNTSNLSSSSHASTSSKAKPKKKKPTSSSSKATKTVAESTRKKLTRKKASNKKSSAKTNAKHNIKKKSTSTQAKKSSANAKRLRQTRLKQAKLKQARLKQAKLKQARLKQAKLKQARLKQAKLKQARLKQAKLKQARLKQAKLKQARLKQVKLKQARLKQAKLKQAKLKQSNNVNRKTPNSVSKAKQTEVLTTEVPAIINTPAITVKTTRKTVKSSSDKSTTKTAKKPVIKMKPITLNGSFSRQTRADVLKEIDQVSTRAAYDKAKVVEQMSKLSKNNKMDSKSLRKMIDKGNIKVNSDLKEVLDELERAESSNSEVNLTKKQIELLVEIWFKQISK